MATIDLSNYATSLFQASSNAFTDGNVFFDLVAGTVEFGDATDYATLNLTTHGGGASDPNPLIRADGVRFEALYAFENQERRTDENLRGYDRFTKGTFKFGGAYDFINNRKPANDATRNLFRGSGWRELNTAGVVNRIYFGFKGLGAVLGTSVPYWQSVQYGATTNFVKQGNLDESILVYQDDDGNGTPELDITASSVYVSVRTYGQNYGRIDTQGTLGIAELGGYSTGAALNESDHLTTANSGESHETLTDVWDGTIGGGGTAVAPFTGMSLEKLVSAQNETGFAGAGSGDFTWVLNNTNSGTLEECVAYLDAIAQADATVTTGQETLNGKAYDVWYEYTAEGRIRPIVGTANAGTEGLFIEGLPTADQTRVEFRDDAQTTLLYPVFTPVTVNIGQGAIDDNLAWFHVFLAAGYNTAGYTEYDDSSSTIVKGVANTGQGFINGTNVEWTHDFTTDGSTNVVMLCEGDGGVTQAKTAFTIADAAVSQSCAPATETNA